MPVDGRGHGGGAGRMVLGGGGPGPGVGALDVVVMELAAGDEEDNVITVNCPDQADRDLCRTILEFGLRITRGDIMLHYYSMGYKRYASKGGVQLRSGSTIPMWAATCCRAGGGDWWELGALDANVLLGMSQHAAAAWGRPTASRGFAGRRAPVGELGTGDAGVDGFGAGRRLPGGAAGQCGPAGELGAGDAGVDGFGAGQRLPGGGTAGRRARRRARRWRCRRGWIWGRPVASRSCCWATCSPARQRGWIWGRPTDSRSCWASCSPARRRGWILMSWTSRADGFPRAGRLARIDSKDEHAYELDVPGSIPRMPTSWTRRQLRAGRLLGSIGELDRRRAWILSLPRVA